MSHTRGAGPGTKWLHSARSGSGGPRRIGRRGSWQFAMERTPQGWQTYASPPSSDQWSQGNMMQTLQQVLGYFDGLNGQGGQGQGQGQGPPGASQSPYYAGPGAGSPNDRPAYPPGYTPPATPTGPTGSPPASTGYQQPTTGPTMGQALQGASPSRVASSGGGSSLAPAGGLVNEPDWED